EDERAADEEVDVVGAERVQLDRDAAERERAGLRVDERNAEQQERRGDGGEDEVLDAALERALRAVRIRDHRVERHRQELEPDEQRREVRRARQHDRAERRQAEQEIDLLLVLRVALHVGVQQRRGGERGRDQERRVAERVVIDGQQ